MSTLTTIAATDIISASRSVINANFATLNSEKVDIAGTYADPLWLTSISGAKVTGGISGNAATATRLATARTIAGVAFDGTANIAIASTGLSDSANLVRTTAANTYTAGNKQTFASNATTAGAAFGGGITADPSSVTAGDFWYRTDLGTFGFRNASAVDALVAGGRALSTVGSVPFVTAAGVLGQSANLFWDNANARLNLGSTVRANGQVLNMYELGNIRYGIGVATSALRFYNPGTGNNTVFGTVSVADGSTFAEQMRLVGGTGNLLLGTTTDDGTNRLQVAGGAKLGGYVLDNGAIFGLSDPVVYNSALASPTTNYAFTQNNTGETVFNGSRVDFRVGNVQAMRLAATTRNLLLGTTTDDGTNRLQVAGGLRAISTTATGFRGLDLSTSDSTTPNTAIRWYGSDNFVKSVIGRNYFLAESIFEVLGTDTNASTSTLQSQFSALSITRNRNTIIGPSPVEGNFRLDVNSSGSSGTLRVYDQTPTAGSTSLVVRAGAGQGSNNLTTWQDASGNAITVMTNEGKLAANNNRFRLEPSVGLELASDVGVVYSSTTSFAGAKDLALSRASANTLQVGDGSANSNGTILARRVQSAGETVANLPAAAAGNAGTITYITDANATTIGSTVAGGGSNKVLVWSNGTAWKIFAS